MEESATSAVHAPTSHARTLLAATATVPPDPSWPPRRPTDELALLASLNKFRGQHGLFPLALSKTLAAAAGWKAMHSANYLYLAHDDPAPPIARPWYERVYDNGWGHEYGFGENGAYSYGRVSDTTYNADAVIQAWTGDSGHLGNMLNSSWTVCGTGVAWSVGTHAGDGSTIPSLPFSWQDYGAGPSDGPPPPPPPPPPPVQVQVGQTWRNKLSPTKLVQVISVNAGVVGYKLLSNGKHGTLVKTAFLRRYELVS